MSSEIKFNGNIGFIGAGNMGGAMIKSILATGVAQAESIMVCDLSEVLRRRINEEHGVYVTYNSKEVAQKSDVLFIAVKPAHIKSVLEEIKNHVKDNAVIISIAVGISLKFLKSILGEDKKIIRTMPNTPAMVSEGMTVVSYDLPVTDADYTSVCPILESFGKVEKLDEKLMNEVTALTGSSPAYVYMFIEAMADAAVLSGIPRALAYRMGAQAVLGSAKMVLETGKHPGELKDMVCSPAGTTIEAVFALEKHGFRAAIMDAMEECTFKAREISKKME